MKRPIRTDYYIGSRLLKTTRAKYNNTACKNAFGHMQVNHYDATHCEVYDEETGVLHAVFKWHVGKNTVEVIFKREVKEGM